MPEMLCHLIGDYCLQNHWMANRKTSSWIAALIHAAFYSLPFALLLSLTVPDVGRRFAAGAIIIGTHAVIDRFRLAKVWIDFWGVGVEGRVVPLVRRVLGVHGQPVESAPPFLGVWLVIIVDNTAHLCINHAALAWAMERA